MKFRVWDKKKKEYIHDTAISEDGSLFIWEDYNGYVEPEDVERFVVEKCTNLKDVGNNDIYENDIVVAESSDNGYLSTVKQIHTGEWKFHAIINDLNRFIYSLGYGCSRWNIIGNINQNPELFT